MSYFGAALGTAVGMMIGLVIYSNAWRVKSYLPKEYDFTHEWGRKFVKTDKKAYTYTMRLLIGIFFHPFIFVFIWSQEGLLKINLFNSDIISAKELNAKYYELTPKLKRKRFKMFNKDECENIFQDITRRALETKPSW